MTQNTPSTPFKNRKVLRADGITSLNSRKLIKKRSVASEAPDFVHYRKMLDCVYWENPTLSLIFEMQSLTGLRFSDCSALVPDDFLDEDGRFAEQFNFTPIKTFNIALHRYHLNPKYNKLTDEEKENRAYNDAMITIFTNERIREVFEEAMEINDTSSHFLFASNHAFSSGNPPSIQYANRLLKKLHSKYRDLGFNKCGTHSWRKYFATSLFRLHGADLRQIQALLGHKNPATTANYITNKEKDLSSLVKNFNQNPYKAA